MSEIVPGIVLIRFRELITAAAQGFDLPGFGFREGPAVQIVDKILCAEHGTVLAVWQLVQEFSVVAQGTPRGKKLFQKE